MSKSTFAILFYARKNQVNKAGKAGIMIRVTVNGESVQFSSKLDIEPELWDATNQKMIGATKAAREFNTLLDEIRTSLRNHYREIEKYEVYVTAEKVRNAFLGITVRQQTLLGTFRKHNEDEKKLIGISVSAPTYAKHDRCLRRLEEYICTKYRLSDIALKEVSHSFIVSFEQFLRTEKQCCQNTTAKFMQTLRKIILIARNNGWITADPFLNYKIRLKRVDRRIAPHPAKEDAVYAIGASARRIHLLVFYGFGLHRRAGADRRQHPHLVRRKAVDHDPPPQDADVGKCPATESTPSAVEEVRKDAAGRTVAAGAEQSKTQLLSERDCRPVRHREKHHLPPSTLHAIHSPRR